MSSPKRKERDPLLALKYRAYCRSQTEPGQPVLLPDLVNMGKFYLCKTLGYLWKDPIWDDYTSEEILIEYFSHLYAKDDELRKSLEVVLDVGAEMYGEDVYDWLDRMIEENQAEMSKKLEEMPDKVTFTPDKDVEE